MDSGERPKFGKAEARSIRDAGWRQGSVFEPPAGFPVPEPFDREREVLVLCSQSCNVVSIQLDKDPFVEFVAASPIEKYHTGSGEAKGKNLRRFHLPVTGTSNFSAVECDFNRRFFVDRLELLSNRAATGIVVSDEHARNLAGWIARNYTRIALPDALAERAKGLFGTILEVLREREPTGEELSQAADKIYIAYEPISELDGGTYDVLLIFLFKDGDSETEISKRLLSRLQPYCNGSGVGGIKLIFDTKVRTQAFVSEFDGYQRLSEWDYLSNLGDVAEAEN